MEVIGARGRERVTYLGKRHALVPCPYAYGKGFCTNARIDILGMPASQSSILEHPLPHFGSLVWHAASQVT
eukprot:scaffold1201_cov413-Prasinococcus_capsulatus_cf.AAC.17